MLSDNFHKWKDDGTPAILMPKLTLVFMIGMMIGPKPNEYNKARILKINISG